MFAHPLVDRHHLVQSDWKAFAVFAQFRRRILAIVNQSSNQGGCGLDPFVEGRSGLPRPPKARGGEPKLRQARPSNHLRCYLSRSRPCHDVWRVSTSISNVARMHAMLVLWALSMLPCTYCSNPRRLRLLQKCFQSTSGCEIMNLCFVFTKDPCDSHRKTRSFRPPQLLRIVYNSLQPATRGFSTIGSVPLVQSSPLWQGPCSSSEHRCLRGSSCPSSLLALSRPHRCQPPVLRYTCGGLHLDCRYSARPPAFHSPPHSPIKK